MKKLHIVLLLILMIGSGVQQLSAQKLMGALTGKWKVIKYQTQSGTQSQIDTLVFQPDGIFLSDSIYFPRKKGLFRTDENRSILILDVNGKTTEWNISIKKGVLRMRSAPGSKKQPRIYVTSVRVPD